MAVWCYECVPCRDPEHPRWAACAAIDALPGDPRIVRLRVGPGARWICAVPRRERRRAIDGVVVRNAAATDAAHCGECQDD